MADPISPELFKKLSALKNLSSAIHEVRNHLDQKTELQKVSTGPLQHLEKSNQSGVITHKIGVKGSAAPHYLVHIDAHKMGKVPHVSVTQMGMNGGLISKHPQRFRNVEDAVKSVSVHHKTGVWQ